MNNKNLSGVPDTLFIPLMARIYISKKFPTYFYDEKALSVEGLLPHNIITKKSSEYAMMASASRAVVMDKVVADFIHRHPIGNVVSIGCGLETMAYRLNQWANQVCFYEVDFPSVMEQRASVLGIFKNETFIQGNANELDFSQFMNCQLPTIFVVAGVFQYFMEHEVVALITKLQNQFSDAELLFDATDSYGIKYVNRYVKKTGNKNALMHFYIDDPQLFAHKAQIKILSIKGFYGEISKEMRKQLNVIRELQRKYPIKKSVPWYCIFTCNFD